MCVVYYPSAFAYLAGITCACVTVCVQWLDGSVVVCWTYDSEVIGWVTLF